jgi:hypothetical protein
VGTHCPAGLEEGDEGFCRRTQAGGRRRRRQAGERLTSTVYLMLRPRLRGWAHVLDEDGTQRMLQVSTTCKHRGLMRGAWRNP